VRDGETGFLAGAATEDALDEALERAWQRRDEWQSIGRAAADAIRQLVPENPARVMANMLLHHAAQPEEVAGPLVPAPPERRS
jgi:hypothetical protein